VAKPRYEEWGTSMGNALGVKNCAALPTTLPVRTGEAK